MASLKRCNTTATEVWDGTKLPRLGSFTFPPAEAALVSPGKVMRVGVLSPYIVVVAQHYPMEYAMNAERGYPRGLGNTFTLEVVAADDQDAIDVVETMLQVDFMKTDTMDIVSVIPAPGVDYRDGQGHTVSVLSSRHCHMHEGRCPYEELNNAVRDEKVIEARNKAIHPMTPLETRVTEAMVDGCGLSL
jgi:hypothetical protein